MPLVMGLLDKEVPVRGVEEREDKFHVDHDWALPEVMRLVPVAAVLINRCASSTTPTSTRQVVV
jgi:hypothetical protein